MVGEKSENFKRFHGKYLYFNKRYRAGVLDPRFPEVREFLASLYENAQKEWNVDGFKFDFIDSFAIAGKDPAIEQEYRGRDFRVIPDAVNVLLAEIVRRLRKNNPDVLIEFRQNYMVPVITQYGNIIRAADCPGDRQANRIRIADLRLTSAKAAVHSDMLEWNVAMTAEEAAGTVISSIFGVVQYSMMLSELPNDHLRMVKHWIDFCSKHEEALYHGKFYGYSPECGYLQLCSEDDNEKIIGVYGNDYVVNLGLSKKQAIILNGTGKDGLCIETEMGKECEVYDTFGGKVTRCKVPSGITRVSVPIGGYVILKNQGTRTPSKTRLD
jgi:alpha-galactosidase